jgi:hypothetical protein
MPAVFFTLLFLRDAICRDGEPGDKHRDSDDRDGPTTRHIGLEIEIRTQCLCARWAPDQAVC